jgi:predicted adenylyl cyclase CyaB
MAVEIEAKLKVDSTGQIEERLIQLGAEFLQEQLQKDYYYDNSDTNLIKTDRALRLRCQMTVHQEKFFLTYKGPKEKDKFKKRQEVEVEVAAVDSAQRLLLALGYEKVLEVEKKRRIWRLGDCMVALDQLPLLGSFVEIEGPDDERIDGLQKSLGLADLQHIPQGYAVLVAEKLHRQR